MTHSVMPSYVYRDLNLTTVTINTADGTANIDGLTMVDRTTAVLNGVVVRRIGWYSLIARNVTVKVVRRNSANNYDVVVNQTFAHGGTGFEDFTITSPYQVATTGDYYLAGYVPSGTDPNVKTSASRSRFSGDMTGTGQVTVAEESGQLYPMRYTYTAQL